mgnify:CR=1 FL=1
MTGRIRRLLALWGPVLGWMLVIFAVSAVPDVPGEPGLPRARSERVDTAMREIAHLGEYAILTALVWRASQDRWPTAHCAAIAGGWSLVYALGDELHQSFVPGRTCSTRDWLIDLCGATLAVLALVAREAWNRRRPKPCELELANRIHPSDAPCQFKQQGL